MHASTYKHFIVFKKITLISLVPDATQFYVHRKTVEAMNIFIYTLVPKCCASSYQSASLMIHCL